MADVAPESTDFQPVSPVQERFETDGPECGETVQVVALVAAQPAAQGTVGHSIENMPQTGAFILAMPPAP